MKGGELMQGKTKKPLTAATVNGSKGKSPQSSNNSIARSGKKVNTLRAIRGDTPARDIVDLVKTAYPKYDETLQSKCEHTDEYGVCLCPGAMRLVIGEFGNLKSTKPDIRKLNNRVQARLSDEDYKALKEQMKADGFTTMQGLLTFLIKNYVKE